MTTRAGAAALLIITALVAARPASADPQNDENEPSRAERLAELRDIERTIARFEEAVGPDQPAYVALGGLHALRAIVQEMAGRPEAAMASARHALELVDDDPALASTCIDAGTILSRVAQARGEGSVAIAAADRAVACALGPGVALSEWAREVSDPVDELLDARQRRSQALWAAGQMARANAEDARIIEIAAAHAPTSADLTERRCARARSVAQAGGAQRSDPIDCHRRTGLHNPPDVRLSAWIALSDIASLRGRPKRAAEALDTALELAMTTPGLDPATLPPLLGKASGRAVERGELDRAASLLDDAAAVAGALAELDPVEQSGWIRKRAALRAEAGAQSEARDLLSSIDLAPLPPDDRVAVLTERAQLHRALDDPRWQADFDAAMKAIRAIDDGVLRVVRQFSLAATALIVGEAEWARELALDALSRSVIGDAMSIDWVLAMQYALIAARTERPTVAIFFAKQSLDAVHARAAERLGGDVDPRWLDQYRTLATLLIETRGRIAEARSVSALVSDLPGRLAVRGPTALREVRVPRSAAETRWSRRYRAAVEAARQAPEPVRARAAFRAAVRALEDEMSAAVVADPADRHPAALRPGEVRVQLIVGQDESRMIVTTAEAAHVATLTIERARLNTLAAELHEALADGGDWRSPAEALHAAIIAPIADHLRGAHTIVWRPDGALRHVPLAVLRDAEAGRFVVQDFAIARDAGRNARPRRPIERVAAFGTTLGGAGLSALPAVGLELGSIVRATADDPTGALPGTVALDDAFTAEALDAALARGGPPAIHIASHFVFRPGAADASFLLLGRGVRLALDALTERRFDGVELLVLSACQTAVGTFAEGQPLDGFASIAIRRGARAVVASLWPVADDGTARLMNAVYAALGEGVPIARALQQAQIAMLSDDETDEGGVRWLALPTERPARSGADPSIWAAFVVTGDALTGQSGAR